MTHRRPLRKAVDEAGLVFLGAILAAVAFNVFSANRLPWIARAHGTGDTISYEELFEPVTVDTVANADTNMAGPDTAAPATDSADLVVPDTTPAVTRADTAAPATRTPPAEGQAREIGTATAREIFDRKAAAWFDARPADKYARRHIPGSHNVYAYDFENNIPRILSLGIPFDKPVVVYCDGGLCDLSHELARNLRILGFQKVVVYTGGIDEWEEHKYPLTEGN